MGVEIRLLGAPRVLRDGEPVVFDTRKAMALLAYLALANHPRPRGGLCELLYPGHDPEKARGALRRTLSTVRVGIGDAWIDTAGDSVALRRGPGLEIDVDRLREGGVDAAARYAGGFLEGFSLRDSPDFDDWQTAAANALERDLVAVLRRQADELAAAGRFDEAVPVARRLLELDPLHEPTHQRLIRLHAWAGDRAAAFEQYRACVRTLSHELGVAPVQETTTLYEQVSDGSLAPPVAPSSPAPRAAAPAAPEALPLVGRSAELEALLAAYDASAADGRVVVLEGESGIGKTRLAEEVAAHARAQGAAVLTARCFDDEAGLPYGPVVELLRQAASTGVPGVAAAHLAEAARLVPELGAPAPAAADDPGAQARLLEAVWSVLGAAARVVVVDDAHAADEATLDALAYLGRRLSGRPVLLVLTWRSEAVPPGHRLRRLVRDAQATVLRPVRLEPDQVAELVGHDPDLAARVQAESEGLPLFVAEVLAAVRDGAEPALAGGLLDARLAGLGDVARQVLGAAASIGRSFDLDTLRHAGGRGDEETVDALEELIAQGLVRESEGSYDFAHGRLRELAYEQLGLARRRLLHARVAEALARRRPAPPHAALVAHHLAEAGDDAGAAEQHVVAADHATSVFAHAEALEHVQAAIALGHPDVAALEERAGALLTFQGDYRGALARLEAAAAGAPPERRAAIEHRIGAVHHRRGEWELAAARFESALAAQPDGALEARVRADLSMSLRAAGDLPRSTELAEQALALAEAAGDRRGRAQAHNLLGVLAVGAGARDAAVLQLDRSLALARELGDAPAEVAALNNLALLRREAGELDAALELTERALALCVRSGDRHREAALENNLADLHHAAGREDEAMAHLKRAVAIFGDVGGGAEAPQPGVWGLVSW